MLKTLKIIKSLLSTGTLVLFLFISKQVCSANELPETSHPPVFLAIYPENLGNMTMPWSKPDELIDFCTDEDNPEFKAGNNEQNLRVSASDYDNPYNLFLNQSSIDSDTKNPDKSSEVISKLFVPVLTLGALAFSFSQKGASIDLDPTSFFEHYGSILVLGGLNNLADGIYGGLDELMTRYNISSVNARGAAAIIMLVPLEWMAVVQNNPILRSKELSFSEAANHLGFKGVSNQANHFVTQLTSSYVLQGLTDDAHPTVRKMIAKSVSASLLATPWIFTVLVDTLLYTTQREKKIYFDSGVGFLFSTAVTTMKSVTQMGIHHLLDGYKDPNYNEGYHHKVDESEITSELLTSLAFVSGWGMLNTASGCSPTAVKKITQQLAKHSLKVAGYGVSAAISNLALMQTKSKLEASIATFITTSFIAYAIGNLKPMPENNAFDNTALKSLKKGFIIPSMNALFSIGTHSFLYLIMNYH